MSNVNAAHPSANVRARFKVLRVNADGKTFRVRGVNDDFEFDVPRVLPIFLPSFPGETVTLREAVTISAELVAGTHDELTAVLIEDDTIFERPDFESVREEEKFWTPYNNPARDSGKL